MKPSSIGQDWRTQSWWDRGPITYLLGSAFSGSLWALPIAVAVKLLFRWPFFVTWLCVSVVLIALAAVNDFRIARKAWQKMRINKAREFVIGGYTPAPRNFDALLVGYHEDKKLMYVAKVRAGFTPALRDSVFKRFSGLETDRCPFSNLPESHRGRWGEGLTAEDMENCRWLMPRLIAVIEYLEWTAAKHLRHSKFQTLRHP